MAETKKGPGRPAGSGKKNTSSGSENAKNAKNGARKPSEPPKARGSRVKDEIFAIIILAIGAFLLIAIQTKAAGLFGSLVGDFFKGSFGLLAYVLPYYLILYGILLFAKKTVHITGKSFALMFLIYLMLAVINSARYIDIDTFSFAVTNWDNLFDGGVAMKNGGFFGMLFGALLVKIIGKSGLYIFAAVVIIICLLLVIDTPVSQFIEKARNGIAAKKAARAEAQAMAEAEDEAGERDKPVAAALQNDRKAADGVITGGNKKEPNVKTSAPAPEPTAKKAEAEAVDFVPGKITDKQLKILTYMNDDDLFESGGSGSNGGKGYGIEPSIMPKEGYGLEGAAKVSVDSETGEIISGSAVATADCASKSSTGAAGGVATGAGASSAVSGTVKQTKTIDPQVAQTVNSQINSSLNSAAVQAAKPYVFPPIDLLNKGSEGKRNNEQQLKMKAAKLESTLNSFNVDAKVIQVTQGPAVTRYEIQPNVGVKVNSIVRLADDIALNLEAKSIRIEAPIPGKAAVGIEVENEKVSMVTIREIIGSNEFKNAKSKITFAVGKDISGNCIVGNLKDMPHMLIAGATGSGKSVCVNSIIASILYKAKPEEVKLVLIDPKVVELSNYNGIPHLLIPVVTEPSKAAAALNWAVAEMDERYNKFAAEGSRDLVTYNEAVKAKKELDLVLPEIVIIIDELADLMMSAPSQIEELICRLAQKARAAGMHLIVATQRPSVDVITGVIKANIPSRIAFAVSSQFDSRTIIDVAGAEKLVGKGDMLYSPTGGGKPLRVQGTFISDTEVHHVIEHVKAQVPEVEYSNDVIHKMDNVNTQTTGEDADELLPEAIETVVSAGQASVSMLQRRFRIGYNRAARIIDMMETRGIIGPADGSRPRQVLMTEEELHQLQEETENL